MTYETGDTYKGEKPLAHYKARWHSETFVGIIDRVTATRLDSRGIVLDLVQPNGAYLRLHLLSEEAEAISQTLGTALHDVADGDTVEQKVG